MIRGIAGSGRLLPPVRPDSRLQLLKASLHRNMKVQFRYRGSQQVGRVLGLQPRSVLIAFRYDGADRTETVKYSSILRTLGP
ncbi:MAG: hypothetical protein JW820_19485 [Spirochaetales bacterium]|nr:hypothetical protein [Spirochaetales bacterium]